MFYTSGLPTITLYTMDTKVEFQTAKTRSTITDSVTRKKCKKSPNLGTLITEYKTISLHTSYVNEKMKPPFLLLSIYISVFSNRPVNDYILKRKNRAN